MSKKALLNDIVICCELRFNRGASAYWKHSDFNDLSREILRETEVNISPNTLKRIFGKISVDDDYLPQQATIDALAKYGGYIPSVTGKPFAIPEIQHDNENKYGNLKKYKPVIFPLVVLLVAGLSVWLFIKPVNNLSGGISQKSMEGVLPSTVFFDLKLPDTKDSLFVDFGDKSPLIYIKPGQKNVAHIFLFPGVFLVKLQNKQDTLASTTVYVRSDKWIGLGFHSQLDIPNRHYEFPAVKTGPDSLFHINNNQLYKTGLDTTGRIYTRLCNYTATGYSSDNFTFEASFKNISHEKGIYCPSTQFQIAGINSIIRFKFVNPGCSFWVLNMVSEQVLDGKKINLSQFVLNLENWNTVRLVNKNKQVSLFVNDKLVYEGTYEKPLGEIKGIFLEFAGNGFVKNCYLKTPEGKMLYSF